MSVPTFEWIEQTQGFFRRYKLLCEGKLVLCLNHAPPEEAYWLRQRRPSIHPLCTPSGVQVTEQGGHTMPHHKAVWIAHGTVGGVNFYADEGEVGLIQTREVTFRATAYVAAIDTRILWVAPDGRTLLEEGRRYRVRSGAQANRVDVETVLATPLDAIDLAQEKHAYFHLRPIDVLSEDQGGVATASNGKTGCDAMYGSEGHWIDLRGKVGPAKVGAIIMGHRDDGPQPLFARSYGTIALNPFLVKGTTLKKGERYRRVYSVTAYDAPESFDRDREYEAFCATAKFE